MFFNKSPYISGFRLNFHHFSIPHDNNAGAGLVGDEVGALSGTEESGWNRLHVGASQFGDRDFVLALFYRLPVLPNTVLIPPTPQTLGEADVTGG